MHINPSMSTQAHRLTLQRATDLGTYISNCWSENHVSKSHYRARFGPNGIRQGARRLNVDRINVSMKTRISDLLTVADCGDVRMYLEHVWLNLADRVIRCTSYGLRRQQSRSAPIGNCECCFTLSWEFTLLWRDKSCQGWQIPSPSFDISTLIYSNCVLNFYIDCRVVIIRSHYHCCAVFQRYMDLSGWWSNSSTTSFIRLIA